MPRSIFETGLGIPAISFKYMKKGDEFEGIQIGDIPEQQQSNPQGVPQFYALPGTRTPDNPKGVPDPNAPMMEGILTILTPLRKWEFVSSAFLEKAEADSDMVDDGRRRLYVKGVLSKPTLLGGLMAELKRTKTKVPEHGSLHRVRLLKKTPIAGTAGEASDVAYVYVPPTSETLAKVEQFKPEPPVASSVFDGDVEADDDPPF